MRRLLYIVQKEFIQILGNKAMLPLMTVLPIIQLILLSFAADNEVKNVNISITDLDHSQLSRQLIGQITASERFTLIGAPPATRLADEDLLAGTADIVLNIPPAFEQNFLKGWPVKLQLLVNAINGQAATVGAGYLNAIIRDFNQDIRLEVPPGRQFKAPQIAISAANWYNPELNYKHFMVPGILGELVIILVILLSAMNTVREREIGTIEQINVTPIRSWQFILGKMIPFVFIGMLLLTVGLTTGKLIFDVPMVGNLGVVFLYCLLNLVAVLGIGLFISNLVDTQQQAMLVAFFFVMVFILMSGLFTPIESMPEWAQMLTIPNPIAHFVAVMRKVLLKGSGLADVAWNFRITAILALVFNGLAVLSYRKVR
ncbi:ABC transporter permease [Neolewinella lacunae]|uniref:ABC transporter permease n=1 Tax=Neolewinella lacunae TaxID=1517758 RepID=A0A923TDQ2_9BACT|nr:ABC transporter permease [Neolewinella lacunae]MBC6995097.1 ABC transporter permease [Neolewinella lacunae]MDN3634047.1 ABC transporter permease [Neolewinella lacunae]